MLHTYARNANVRVTLKALRVRLPLKSAVANVISRASSRLHLVHTGLSITGASAYVCLTHFKDLIAESEVAFSLSDFIIS